ncbi:hypothetical protein HDU67_002993, partial [Dinochytrium kinnereticum]
LNPIPPSTTTTPDTNPTLPTPPALAPRSTSIALGTFGSLSRTVSPSVTSSWGGLETNSDAEAAIARVLRGLTAQQGGFSGMMGAQQGGLGGMTAAQQGGYGGMTAAQQGGFGGMSGMPLGGVHGEGEPATSGTMRREMMGGGGGVVVGVHGEGEPAALGTTRRETTGVVGGNAGFSIGGFSGTPTLSSTVGGGSGRGGGGGGEGGSEAFSGVGFGMGVTGGRRVDPRTGRPAGGGFTQEDVGGMLGGSKPDDVGKGFQRGGGVGEVRGPTLGDETRGHRNGREQEGETNRKRKIEEERLMSQKPKRTASESSFGLSGHSLRRGGVEEPSRRGGEESQRKLVAQTPDIHQQHQQQQYQPLHRSPEREFQDYSSLLEGMSRMTSTLKPRSSHDDKPNRNNSHDSQLPLKPTPLYRDLPRIPKRQPTDVQPAPSRGEMEGHSSHASVAAAAPAAIPAAGVMGLTNVDPLLTMKRLPILDEVHSVAGTYFSLPDRDKSEYLQYIYRAFKIPPS